MVEKKNKKENLLLVLGLVILIGLTGGVTYAFFNYLRIGEDNLLKLGKISFSASDDGVVELTNVFPITKTEAEDDTDNSGEVVLNIRGNTTYTDGIEYEVRSVELNNIVDGKYLPIGIIVSSENLGEEDEEYFTNRDSKNKTMYKVEATTELRENGQMLVGYIKAGETGVNGTFTIKAFIDKDKIAVSDTYNGSESEMMGTGKEWVYGRSVFTTSEWNSIQGNNALSFKIKVEANEGIWVEEKTTINAMNYVYSGSGNIMAKNTLVREINFIRDDIGNLMKGYNQADYKSDVTYNNEGKVLAWLVEDEENPGKYIMNIGSDGKVYLTTGNGFFSPFNNSLEKVSFGDNIDTSRVTDMGGMFSGCSKLKKADLTSFDTSNVTNMASMFYGNTSLVEADLSSFDTSSLTSTGMNTMFYGDSSLNRIAIGEEWDASNQIEDNGMFYNCSSIVGGNGTLYNSSMIGSSRAVEDSETTVGYLTKKENDLDSINVMGTFPTAIQNVRSNIREVQFIKLDNETMDERYNAASVKVDITYNSQGKVLAWVENNKLYVASDGITYLSTGEELFNNFKNLTKIDFGNSNTVKVTSLKRMFKECDSLQYIDISSFITPNLTTVEETFYGCDSLQAVILDGLGSDNLSRTYSLFYYCNNLKYISMKEFNFGVVNFYNNSNYNYAFSYLPNVEMIDLTNANTSGVTNMYGLFLCCKRLKTIILDGIDTSSVTSMYDMFYDCDAIKTIDLSDLDTSNVTNMTYMFANCDSLEAIILDGLGSDNLTEMYAVFSSCNNLKYISMKNFNFGKLGSIGGNYGLFYGLSNLISVDLSSANASNIGNVTSMFKNCSKLSYVNLDKISLNTIYRMFYECTATNIDLMESDLSSVQTAVQAFYQCSNLESVNLKNVNLSNITSMDKMFYGCQNMIVANLENLNVQNSLDMLNLFYQCEKLETVNLKNVDARSVKQTCYMFYYCIRLTDLNITNLIIDSVVNMYQMFYCCYALNNLDFSNINTPNLEILTQTFYGCRALKTINLSNFGSDKLDSVFNMFGSCDLETLIMNNFNFGRVYLSNDNGMMGSMFNNSIKIKKIYLNNIKAPSTTSFYRLFYRWGLLEEVYMSNVEVGNVTSLAEMFYQCERLEKVEMDNLDTSKVTNMTKMFSECSVLETLELNDFDMSSVVYMNEMFRNCQKLKTLKLDFTNTTNLVNLEKMFYDCYDLETLDLSGFNTINVTNTNYMFYYCSKLTTIYVSDSWTNEKMNSSNSMFSGCTLLVGGNNTVFNWSYTDKTYAIVDGTDGQPGYLTLKTV